MVGDALAGGEPHRPDAAGRPGPERLLVALLAFGTVAALWVFREADDNRLTSWSWIFGGASPIRLYAATAVAIALASLAARRPLRLRGGLALFAGACAAAACFWGTPEVIVDAARYFAAAKHLELHGLGDFLAEWGRGVPAWTDLPLLPAVDGLLFRTFGESRIVIQAFTTLLFAGTVLLTHRIGRSLWSDEVGLAAGALLLAMPFLLAQVPALLVDVPTMFFLALAILAAVRAFERGTAGSIALAAAAVALAALSKYSAWLFLSVVPVVGVVQWSRGAPRPLRTGALLALAAGALVAAALFPVRAALPGQAALLLGYQAPGLGRWGESFTSTFLFQIHPFVTAGAALSLWVAVRRRDPRWAIAAWPVLLLLVLQVRRARYAIPALPALALMAAYGLQAIRAREVRRLAVGCAVASSLAVAGIGYLPFLRSTSAMNLKAAGEYLDTIAEERVDVFTLPQPGTEVNPAIAVPMLDLFTGKALFHLDDGIPRPAPPGLETSSLRFTWECERSRRDPAGGEEAAVVVVAGEADPPLPEPVARRLRRYRPARTFAVDEGVFRYRTLVTVYRADAPAVQARRDGP